MQYDWLYESVFGWLVIYFVFACLPAVWVLFAYFIRCYGYVVKSFSTTYFGFASKIWRLINHVLQYIHDQWWPYNILNLPHFRTHPHVSPAIHWDVAIGSPRPDSDTFCTSLLLLAQGLRAHGAALANGKARVPAAFCESGCFVAVAIDGCYIFFPQMELLEVDLMGLRQCCWFSVDLLRSWLEWQPVDLQISSSERFRTATFSRPRCNNNRKIWLQ